VIRVVWGTGRGSTEKGSFDAALAAANVHQYNLRTLSSVIPAGAEVEEVGTAPDLSPTGYALDVVLARQTSPPETGAVAGLAWARGEDGAGVFYEEGDHDPAAVGERLEAGIQRGCELRGIDPSPDGARVVTTDPEPDAYVTAAVVAVYGEGEPLC
jgi:arginine decarboxylase